MGVELSAVVEENKAKYEETRHHAECTSIVRIGSGQETLVLRVLQRTNDHLV
jgi:hypothetical protein